MSDPVIAVGLQLRDQGRVSLVAPRDKLGRWTIGSTRIEEASDDKNVYLVSNKYSLLPTLRVSKDRLAEAILKHEDNMVC